MAECDQKQYLAIRLQLSKFGREWRKLCNLIVYQLKNMTTLDLALNDQQNDLRFHRESVNPMVWIS